MSHKSINLDVFRIIKDEEQRQKEQISLIASENYASLPVRQAQGSFFTNKYAEGYPSKRYYGGCKYADQIENIAQQLAQNLFKTKYVNVQPVAGSQANQAVYQAFLKPGDTILSMSLDCGGHLSHGHKVSVISKFYKVINYELVDETFDINYEQVEQLAIEHKPKIIVAGFSAFSLTVDWEKFRKIADKVQAIFMADIAHVSGLIAAGAYPSPVQYADVITSTTHKTLRGPRGAIILTNNLEYFKKIQKAVFPGMQGGPFMHAIAARAQAFYEASQDSFKKYSRQIILNARCMFKVFKEQGLKLVHKKVDNHMMLIDLSEATRLNGAEAEQLLEKNAIVVNKNAVPNNTNYLVPTGIRIGTAAITSRGMKEKDCSKLALLISKLLKQEVCCIKDEILDITKAFPIPEFYD